MNSEPLSDKEFRRHILLLYIGLGIGFTLFIIGFILQLLTDLGIIGSPSPATTNGFINGGLLITLGSLAANNVWLVYGFKRLESIVDRLDRRVGKLESKVDVLWDDFKKQKAL